MQDKLGEGDKELAVSNHRIGSACYCLGDYEEARKKHEQGESQKPEIAASYNWIGKDYLQLAKLDEGKLDEGKLEKAKENLEKSLRLRREHLVKDHPDIAKSLISLGEYYETIGDLDKAIEKTEKARDIRVEKLQHDNPERRLEELKRKKQAHIPPGQEKRQ